jgi:hypothetical protein
MARPEVNLPRIVAWSQRRHDWIDGDDMLMFTPSPSSVRRLALPLYRRYRKFMLASVDEEGYCPLHPFSLCLGEESVPIFEAACYLVHALELHGLSYQRIVELSNKQVADIVCSISSDLRENDTKRHNQLVERISQAPPEARIIKTAEVYEAVRLTLARRIEPTLVDARRRNTWLQERLEVIENAAMNELVATPVGPFLVNLRRSIRSQLEPIREIIRSNRKRREFLVASTGPPNGHAAADPGSAPQPKRRRPGRPS